MKENKNDENYSEDFGEECAEEELEDMDSYRKSNLTDLKTVPELVSSHKS